MNRVVKGGLKRGEFIGFDPWQPTSRAGGKAIVVQNLKREHGFKIVVMIGDGATDMEARDVEVRVQYAETICIDLLVY